MKFWLAVASAVFALVACGAWFLSTRPILYTRLFVNDEERPLVRRDILGNPSFGRRMRWIGFLNFVIGLGCAAAAFLVRL